MTEARVGRDFIAGAFRALHGDALAVRDPSDGATIVWRATPVVAHVHDAVAAAREAQRDWSQQGFDARAAMLRRYAELAASRVEEIAECVAREMGKLRSEAVLEAKLIAEKVAITLEEHSLARTRGYEIAINATRVGACAFRPHGVMVVLGPFNFPAHLPNGQFVPALLAGNTVVFKPSEKAPGVAEILAECMAQAGLPKGAFNVVHGGAEIARALTRHDGIDGILFTGSFQVGRAILESNLDRPGRIVALEMGGSNASIVWGDCDLRQAVVECARAAFATTGQRCTCTRRILVDQRVAARFIKAFCEVASNLAIGPACTTDPVFMGPLVSEDAVTAFLLEQERLAQSGARILVKGRRLERAGAFVTASVCAVDRFICAEDRETFAPLVRIATVATLEDAITQANASDYGLAASVFTADDAVWQECFSRLRVGCINRNTGTAGASSRLPFGGVGKSGNHRPAAAFAMDFCAFPISSLIEQSHAAPVPVGMRADEGWFS